MTQTKLSPSQKLRISRWATKKGEVVVKDMTDDYIKVLLRHLRENPNTRNNKFTTTYWQLALTYELMYRDRMFKAILLVAGKPGRRIQDAIQQEVKKSSVHGSTRVLVR